ncbi:MAG TPA: hypothetical protein VFH47_01895 [Candidatus Thermoplasmatota archaeon]|nr:hypothetical protein [Candidatus Thermoplasmatota archaeon]
MRLTLAALATALLLAGCAQPFDPQDEAGDPIQPCPQWLSRPETGEHDIQVAAGNTSFLPLPGNDTYQGLPLDRVLLRVTSTTGDVSVQARNVTSLRDLRGATPQDVPIVRFNPERPSGMLDVLLRPVREDVRGPAGTPAFAFTSTGGGSIQFEATYSYRVCGQLR